MATQAGDGHLDKKDAREILDLKVKEVSLVDRPAIEREFLLIKRKEEESMGAFEPDKDGVVDELIEKMTWHDIDVDKALPPDLASAIKDTVAWMKKAAGMEGAPKDAINRVAAFLSKVAGGKYPYPKPAGKTDDTSKADKCPKCGADMKDGVCTNKDCGYKAAVQKRDDVLTAELKEDGTIEIGGEPVTKGVKGFTAERTKAFGNVVKTLLGMMADIEPEQTKAIVEELVKATLPADLKWKPGTMARDAAAVKKELTDIVAAALEPISKQLADTASKVEEISKARSESQSDGGDDNTDKEVNKGKKFWEGVPV